MQEPETNHHHHHHHHHHHDDRSDTEALGNDGTANSCSFSEPQNKKGGQNMTDYNSSGSDESVKFNKDTSFVHDDSGVVHGVKTAGGADGEDPELMLPAKVLEEKSSFSSSVVGKAFSSKMRQISLKLTRFSRQSFKELKFISKTDGGGAAEWAVVEKKFNKLTATTNSLLPRSLFWDCIGMKKDSKEFAGRLFDALARRRNITGDSITKAQLKEFWDQISDQSTFESRLQTFFDMVDKDANGKLTEEEVQEIISLSASTNKLSNIQEQADEYAALIMKELDPDHQGYIMIENLEMRLLQAPSESVRGGEKRNLSRVLSQELKPEPDHNPIGRCCQDFKYFLQDNWQRAWVMALWMGLMAGLFAYKYVQYRNKAAFEVMGHCLCMAKGAAETLKLNMALILLPVCRKTITWLRNKTRLGVAVPFDDNLNFHKVVAVAIAIGVWIHSILHLACDFPKLLNASPEKYKPMEKYFGKQPTSYWHFVMGVEGVTGLIMGVLMAIAFTLAIPWLRRSNENLPKFLKQLTGFNAFWYSHHLLFIVYALLIVHGIKLYLTHQWCQKTTWMYLAVPITLYAIERLIRAFRSSIEPVKIEKAVDYEGKLLVLHMSKPQGFEYKSGQYMFVKCADVSPFEWHPFSITSAPGDDCLSVHIRIVGDWTGQLRKVFSKPPPARSTGLPRPDCLQEQNNPIYPRVFIDGPYGAPAQDYKKYEVVLLVGLGIGTTPMISIVKDILNNMKAMDEEENALEDGNGIACGGSPSKQNPGSTSGSNFRTRRAYFYWSTREQSSFEWFAEVMNEVAKLDHKGIIEMHNYCTSVYEEGDARSAFIAMLQSLDYAKNGKDCVSGTCVKCHFAKPNWRSVYKRIARKHNDAQVGVFYCGPPAVAKELRQLALDFSRETKTRFDFHKENF